MFEQFLSYDSFFYWTDSQALRVGGRKRDKSFEIAKSVAALALLGLLLLVGGDYRKLPELLPVLFEWLLAVVSLILFGILAFYFIRSRRGSAVQSQAAVPIPVKIKPVMNPAPPH